MIHTHYTCLFSSIVDCGLVVLVCLVVFFAGGEYTCPVSSAIDGLPPEVIHFFIISLSFLRVVFFFALWRFKRHTPTTSHAYDLKLMASRFDHYWCCPIYVLFCREKIPPCSCRYIYSVIHTVDAATISLVVWVTTQQCASLRVVRQVCCAVDTAAFFKVHTYVQQHYPELIACDDVVV